MLFKKLLNYEELWNNDKHYYIGLSRKFMTQKKRKTLLLLDSNALVHRSYHALPPLTTKDGELVNAVYGVSSTLLSVLTKFKPDYVIASFDLQHPTFRHKAYKDYKANRKKAPDDLYSQIPLIKDMFNNFGISIFEKKGYEADDVIGTLAHLAEEEEIDVVIVTGDNDALQLVTDHVKVFTMRRGITDTVVYDTEAVIARYDLTPEQLIDYKGLRGDASDNIPGVRGVGEKTATQLLVEYQTLENVYDHLDDIKPAVRAKLEKDRANAKLSKILGTIVVDVPLDNVDFATCESEKLDYEKLKESFIGFNFYSLVKRLPGEKATSVKKEQKGAKKEKKGGVQDFKYSLPGENDHEKICSIIGSMHYVAIACDQAQDGQLRGIAVSHKTGRAAYIPYEQKYKTVITDLCRSSNVEKIGFDSKEMIHVFQHEEIMFNAPLADVMLQSYVLDPGRKIIFEDLVMEVFEEEIIREKDAKQLSMDLENCEETMQKTMQRADYIYKLHEHFAQEIKNLSKEQQKKSNVQTLYDTIEMPLVPILATMEENGIMLNTTVFAGISETLEGQIKTLEKKIHALAGQNFNINSPQQLSIILFEDLAIPTKGIKKTKKGYSTAAGELEKIRTENPIIEKIEQYREIFKLKTTYLDPLPTYVDKKSRLHTKFNQAVTATGRLSSSDPNLQNIPMRSELGQLVRTAFIAEDGYKLVSVDYSQIDLRCVAHVAQDKMMIKAFRNGEDIHQTTAAAVNDVTPSAVTKKMRRDAKSLNFGLIYGMGSFSFAQATGVDQETAKKFIEAYMKKFSGVARYMKQTRAEAKEKGYVETLLGRRRTIPEIASANFQVAAAGERMAINMPIQGLTADIMKLAMIAVIDFLQKKYKNDEVRMILQIHDEIMVEVHEEIAQQVAQEMANIMENVYQLDVPLVVDARIGATWGEL